VDGERRMLARRLGMRGGRGDSGGATATTPAGVHDDDDDNVLTVKSLVVNFHTFAGDVKALDGVNLSVRKGEVLGLVGESGSGKSVTALSIEGLLPQNAEVVGGQIILDGKDLRVENQSEIRVARLREIAMVFQDPLTYLNPVLTVGSQIVEILDTDRHLFTSIVIGARLEELERAARNRALTEEEMKEKGRLEAFHIGEALGRREFKRLAREYAVSVLRSVRLPEPERMFNMYPFELSGGMRQRTMIAMALVRRPSLLIADEITTALDVTVQAQILKLLRELKTQIAASILLITHDLAVVAEICDRVAVMYAGNIVEVAEVNELFKNPLHPYTQGLLAAIPRPDAVRGELNSIKGSVPNLIYPPSGCRFHPRCPSAFAKCPTYKPPLIEVGSGHFVECFLYGG
jgi:peptide/nickel transport system ATP-binding protein